LDDRVAEAIVVGTRRAGGVDAEVEVEVVEETGVSFK
jgi:hypothetical protein